MKFIVLDGIDGVGKSTQVECLANLLTARGFNAKSIKFPGYQQPTGQLIRAYLQGDIKTTNIYQSSIMYALDRAVAFNNIYTDAMKYDFVVCDRYTSANLIHQMPILPKSEWTVYMHWLQDLEHTRLNILRPDITILLTADLELVKSQLNARFGVEGLDIIERDSERTLRSLEAITFLGEHGYTLLDCTKDATHIKSIPEITNMLWNLLVSRFPELDS